MPKRQLPVVDFDIEDKEGFVYQFLGRHTLAVLATTDLTNQPEAAVIEFSELKTLELVFDTYSIFRKYKNMLSNQRVALVIGWDCNTTLQYEGRAVELEGPELEASRAVHLQKFPDAIQFEQYEGMKYFKVLPTWLRYTDMSGFPWKRFELQFNQ